MAWRLATPIALLLLPGCLSSGPDSGTRRLPNLGVRTTHYVGDPLAGPLPSHSGTAVEAERSITARCRSYYLERLPPVLDPLGSRLELVIGMLDRRPVLPSAALLAGARLGVGPEAARIGAILAAGVRSSSPSEETPADPAVPDFGAIRPIETTDALVPTGCSALFQTLLRDPVLATPGQTTRAEMSIAVSKNGKGTTSDGLRISLVLQDRAPGKRPGLRRQLISLEDAPEPDGPPLVLILPTLFERDSERAVAFVIEAKSVGISDPAFALLREDCRRSLARTADSLARAASSERDFDLEAQTDAMRQFVAEGADGRLDLIYATGPEPLSLLRDLAFSGSDDDLDRLAQTLSESGDTSMDPFALTAHAVRMVLDRLDSGALSPELDALLIEHTGQLARRPSRLRASLDTSSSLAAFRKYVIAENIDSLGDADPGARVRAFDWLAVRGLTIEGFQPLDPEQDRRAALRAYRESEQR